MGCAINLTALLRHLRFGKRRFTLQPWPKHLHTGMRLQLLRMRADSRAMATLTVAERVALSLSPSAPSALRFTAWRNRAHPRDDHTVRHPRFLANSVETAGPAQRHVTAVDDPVWHTWVRFGHLQAGTALHVLQELGGWSSYENVRTFSGTGQKSSGSEVA
jgi:hypothetical protein